MAEGVAFFGRQQFTQLHFDLVGIFGVHQSQPSGNTDAMGIGHHRWLAVNIAADQVGGFAAHTGQLNQFLNRVGNDTVIVIPQHTRHSDDIPRLGFI